MTFGWHGFAFDHPDDWAPSTFAGHRRQGYIRLSSPAAPFLHLRWESVSGPPNIESFLRQYLAKLERDSRRASHPFRSNVTRGTDTADYTYSGNHSGKGIAFRGACGRMFILEVGATSGEPKRRHLQSAFDTFQSDQPRDRWALLGLDVNLPRGLNVDRPLLVAGRTRLTLRSPKVEIVAERWGFANQLLKAHPLEEWARSLLGWSKAEMTVEGDRLRLSLPPRWPRKKKVAIVQCQSVQNQIVLVTSTFRDDTYSPTWDWFNV